MLIKRGKVEILNVYEADAKEEIKVSEAETKKKLEEAKKSKEN
jgi:hypothetical protein